MSMIARTIAMIISTRAAVLLTLPKVRSNAQIPSSSTASGVSGMVTLKVYPSTGL